MTRASCGFPRVFCSGFELYGYDIMISKEPISDVSRAPRASGPEALAHRGRTTVVRAEISEA